MTDNNNDGNNNGNLWPLKRITHAVYLCQTLSFFTAVSGIVGVVINYIKRDEVKGTWLDSHFTWQIRTFWISLALYVSAFFLSFVVVGFFAFPVIAIWNIYRIIKGWLLLNDGKPIKFHEQRTPCMRCKID